MIAAGRKRGPFFCLKIRFVPSASETVKSDRLHWLIILYLINRIWNYFGTLVIGSRFVGIAMISKPQKNGGEMKDDGNLHCSFCGKTQAEVRRLYAASWKMPNYICGDCVQQTYEMVIIDEICEEDKKPRTKDDVERALEAIAVFIRKKSLH